MFDGWSYRVVYYVSIMVSYVQDIPVKKRDVLTTESVQRISGFALSPMAKSSKVERSSNSPGTHGAERSTSDADSRDEDD